MLSHPIVDIRDSFGAAFVGLLVSTIFFGWTIAQTCLYFWNYGNRDSKLLKFFVAFVTFMDALHTIMCAYAIYWYLVLNFGNLESLGDSMWAMNVRHPELSYYLYSHARSFRLTQLQVILSVIIGDSVQFYYARRVYVVSRSIICPILIVVVVVIGSGAGLYLNAKQFALKHFASVHSFVWPTYVAMGSIALGDSLVAASMCWSLYRRRTGFAKTDSIILTLMTYSINSGLLTRYHHDYLREIFPLQSFPFETFLFCDQFVTSPTSLVWVVFSWAMSKCYVNSFLAMLNSRDYIRGRSDPSNPDNAYHLSSVRVGQLSEAAVCVSVHRSTTFDYGRDKSDPNEGPTFEVPKPDATIVPLKC
ncbi:hypothetical protein EDB92DRAFT_1947632 [Lactarius akahatsu]|uniref:DUF6534 domain-containing protein n=1 Tax=Lactarius akahatsu TaxID=416441 RepID=A0AAD4LIZ9_9AGAM|nr:hypothetical protein EDB92DRAFT_1947632 [Lactarius akahatsu]